ncbi:MAG: hypothetical protein NTV72_01095, partial [Candidatus Taylorbacteria bacterium]|nr:hypothetical protein [Candidatus Taylorbacteria bacterium]
MKKTLRNILVISFVFIAFLTLNISLVKAETGVPSIVSYQGHLSDSGGNPLGGTGANYYFKFSLWDNPTVGSGSKVWPVNTPGVSTLQVKQGLFSVNIGDTDNSYPDVLDYNFANNKKVYLQVEISSDNANFETLSPRSTITASAFSRVSAQVNGVAQSSIGTTTALDNSVLTLSSTSTNSTALSILGISGQGANLLNVLDSALNSLFAITASGNVGIGTTSPLAKLDVYGTAGSADIFALSSSTNARLFTVAANGSVQIGSTGSVGSTTLIDPLDVVGTINAVNADGSLALKLSPSSQGSPAVNLQFGQYNVYGGLADLRFTSWWGQHTYMTIKGSDASGNVSIGPGGGRGLPSNQLEVYASSIGTTTVPKIADYSGIKVTNTAISSTNNLIKSGVRISSTGSWTGSSSSNIGLYVSSVSGGTNNYDAIFNGGGNLGIGTTTPLAKLDVYGTAGSADIFALSSSTNARLFTVAANGNVSVSGALNVTGAVSASAIGNIAVTGNDARFMNANGKLLWTGLTAIGNSDGINGNLKISNYGGTDFSRLQFGGTTSSFPALSISTSTSVYGSALQVIGADGVTNANLLVTGNVGVGTANPTHTLELNSSNYWGSNGGMQVGELYATSDIYTPAIYPTPSTSDLAFSIRNNSYKFNFKDSSGNSLMSVLGSGNVGIGTTSPVAKLHLVGTTEQLRLGYNSLNFNTFTVNSAGAMTLASNGTGPDITLQGGTTGATPGGNIILKGGNSSNQNAGGLLFTGGSVSSNNANGGGVSFTGGIGANSTGVGGGFTFTGGAGGPTGATGGSVTLITGNGGSSSGNSGSLALRTGTVASGTVGSISLQTNGTNTRLFIDGTGNVGIGTTTPSTTLTVVGTSTLLGHVLPGTDNTYSLGASGNRWASLYSQTLNT